MSDNEPLDLDQIAEWYNGLYQPEINEVYEPWAKYIAALLGEVKRLRAHVSDLQKIALAVMAQESQDLGLYDYYPEPDEKE